MAKTPIRLTVDISLEVYQHIEEMAWQSRSTKADVMRKSLGLMSVALSTKQKKDERIAIVNDKDEVVTEIIGF